MLQSSLIEVLRCFYPCSLRDRGCCQKASRLGSGRTLMALKLFYFSSFFPFFFVKVWSLCVCNDLFIHSYKPIVSASSPPWLCRCVGGHLEKTTNSSLRLKRPLILENWCLASTKITRNLEEVMNQLVELRHEAIHDHWRSNFRTQKINVMTMMLLLLLLLLMMMMNEDASPCLTSFLVLESKHQRLSKYYSLATLNVVCRHVLNVLLHCKLDRRLILVVTVRELN